MDGSVTFNPIIEEWPNHPKANRGSSVTPKQQFLFFFLFFYFNYCNDCKGGLHILLSNYLAIYNVLPYFQLMQWLLKLLLKL
jgi:hypothetical protein